MLYALGNFVRQGNLTAQQLIFADFETFTTEIQLFDSSNPAIVQIAKEVQKLLASLNF